MADWKSHLTYNHGPSYHAYAYGLLYPNGFEQNLGGGGDAGPANARSNLAAPTPVYRAADVVKAQESPPDSPEEHTRSGQYQYSSPDFSYLRENAAEQVIFNKQRQASVGQQPHEARQTGSDTASDSDTYISPGNDAVNHNFYRVFRCFT